MGGTYDDDKKRSSTEPAESTGATFAREGPEPATEDSGETVDEMNDAAARALRSNVRPEGHGKPRRQE